ncbi:MAG TPA: aspartate-semialdehyde dehydrogenase [Vicinamibacterales bacterium]|nr:aspartate-semialdehyde dehydrogenase [Vicinamibacterales bacterium]
MAQIEVGILGATGMVGQQFIALLAKHPWFKVTWLGASQRSEGKTYRDAAAWRLPTPAPDDVSTLVVEQATPGNAPKIMFSGLDSSVAGEIEGAFAQAGHLVISNSKNYRLDTTVPLMIPEINAEHLKLLSLQEAARGWKGRIVTNPNCSVVALSMALAPLRPFGLRTALVTTMQAISGAGYPGVASWDILGNVVPFIDGEEEKFQPETQKILGRFGDKAVEPHPVIVSATATRVPVHDGHTISASVTLEEKVAAAAIVDAFNCFRGRPQELKLPSAPPRPVVYLTERNRPQPALDVNRDGGMTVTVGRLRPCPIFDYKFVALGHNTIRGAAGAAILNAELMREEGLL